MLPDWTRTDPDPAERRTQPPPASATSAATTPRKRREMLPERACRLDDPRLERRFSVLGCLRFAFTERPYRPFCHTCDPQNLGAG